MPLLPDIRIRDPFILPLAEEQTYYLYGTTDENCWEGPADGFDCYWSRDLKQWEGPRQVFAASPQFWSDRNYWAPEAHRYEGRFVMLASFKSAHRRRGTQILV